MAPAAYIRAATREYDDDDAATNAEPPIIAFIIKTLVTALSAKGFQFPSSSWWERPAPVVKYSMEEAVISAAPLMTPIDSFASNILAKPTTCPMILIRTAFRHVSAAWRSCFSFPAEEGFVFWQASFADLSLALSDALKFNNDRAATAKRTIDSAWVVTFVALYKSAPENPA